MTRTLETIFAEWKRLEGTTAALTAQDHDAPAWIEVTAKMDALEIEMRIHPARTLREAAMKLEPYFINTERDPNFTGVLEDLRAQLAPAERARIACPAFVYCARLEAPATAA